jgi:hypothetical protein
LYFTLYYIYSWPLFPIFNYCCRKTINLRVCPPKIAWKTPSKINITFLTYNHKSNPFNYNYICILHFTILTPNLYSRFPIINLCVCPPKIIWKILFKINIIPLTHNHKSNPPNYNYICTLHPIIFTRYIYSLFPIVVAAKS